MVLTGAAQEPRDWHMRLRSVTLTGSDGSSTLPSPAFQYGQAGARAGEISRVDNGYGAQVLYGYENGLVRTRTVSETQTGSHTYYFDYEGQDAGGGHRRVRLTTPYGTYTQHTFHTTGDRRGRAERVEQGGTVKLAETRYEYGVWNGYESPFVYLSSVTTDLPSGGVEQGTYQYDFHGGCGEDCYGNLTSAQVQLNGGTDVLETAWTYYPPAGQHFVTNRLQSEIQTYDPDGNPAHTTRSRSYYEYEADGDLLTAWQGDLIDGYLTRLKCDTFGNVTSATDGRGNTTRYVYDGTHHSFPVTVTYANGFVETASYDARFGAVDAASDVNGLVTEYGYDPFGRPDTVTWAYGTAGAITTDHDYSDVNQSSTSGLTMDTTRSGGGASETTRQIYNGLGQLMRSGVQGVYDGSGGWSYVDRTYDALGRLDRVSLPHAGTAGQWTAYQYTTLWGGWTA